MFRKIYFPIIISLSIFYNQNVLCNDTTYCEKQSQWIVTGKYHYGFVIPHVRYLEYFIVSHINGVEVNFGIKSNTNETWQTDFWHPELGVGYYHSNLGNDEIYGHANALFLYAGNALIGRKRDSRVKLLQHLGFGIGYIDKAYDYKKNYFAMAIGTKLNAYVNYALDLDIRLTKRFQLIGGLGLTHFSNGSFSQPNKGINICTSSFGLKYLITTTNKKINCIANTPFIPHNEYTITFAPGIKQETRFEERRYFESTLGFDYGRHYKSKYIFGGGVDFFYDGAMKENLEVDTLSSIDYYKCGTHLSFEIFANKVGFMLQPGIYLFNKYRGEYLVYNRLAIIYHLNKHISARISVKAKWRATADYIEWGISYTL
jgi:hypothetical protein